VNVRRGLFRVWILVAALSTLMSLSAIEIYAPLEVEDFWFLTVVWAAPWIVTVTGLAVRWAYNGFQVN
jgi:hypothetical protein